jgi:hypothetical protein
MEQYTYSIWSFCLLFSVVNAECVKCWAAEYSKREKWERNRKAFLPSLENLASCKSSCRDCRRAVVANDTPNSTDENAVDRPSTVGLFQRPSLVSSDDFHSQSALQSPRLSILSRAREMSTVAPSTRHNSRFNHF